MQRRASKFFSIYSENSGLDPGSVRQRRLCTEWSEDCVRCEFMKKCSKMFLYLEHLLGGSTTGSRLCTIPASLNCSSCMVYGMTTRQTCTKIFVVYERNAGLDLKSGQPQHFSSTTGVLYLCVILTHGQKYTKLCDFQSSSAGRNLNLVRQQRKRKIVCFR